MAAVLDKVKTRDRRRLAEALSDARVKCGRLNLPAPPRGAIAGERERSACCSRTLSSSSDSAPATVRGGDASASDYDRRGGVEVGMLWSDFGVLDGHLAALQTRGRMAQAAGRGSAGGGRRRRREGPSPTCPGDAPRVRAAHCSAEQRDVILRIVAPPPKRFPPPGAATRARAVGASDRRGWRRPPLPRGRRDGLGRRRSSTVRLWHRGRARCGRR